MHLRLLEIKAKLINMWENIFVSKRSNAKNLFVASLIVAIGFSLIYLIYNLTKIYFTSLIILTVISVVFYSGFRIGLFFAILLSIVADYLFIPPIGTVFDSVAGNEHFAMIISIAIFATVISSTIKSTFQKVAVAKKEAELATAMMEKVLALVVHDIRNPLTIIKMGAQLILKNSEQLERHQNILSKMVKTIDHADALIKTLLDTASIKAGKTITLVFENCDLNKEVTEIIEEMSLVHSDIIQFISNNEPIIGNWGINGIKRALENLITNAIKYGTPNSPIVIKLINEGELVTLSVHNEGKEITLEEQKKLFDTFQRTKEAENSKIEGWGIGLSLIKKIAEAHNGVVLVDSEKDKGTTFTLKFFKSKSGLVEFKVSA